MKEFLRSFLCFWPCADNDNTAYFEHMYQADRLRAAGKLREALAEYQLATASYKTQPGDNPAGELRSESASKAIGFQLSPARRSTLGKERSIAEIEKEWEMRKHWEESARIARKREEQEERDVSNLIKKIARHYGS